MYKYVSALVVLSMCACSHTSVPQNASSATEVEVHYSAPITAAANTVSEPEATVPAAGPLTVEVPDGKTFQVLRCHDDLDCLQKVTGFCSNGYTGGQKLAAENDRRVGIAFRCITDEEKALRQKEEAEEKAWRENRMQQIRDEQAAAAKKAAAKKK